MAIFGPNTISMNAATPYNSLPEVPDTISASLVLSRMVDALGFRYRWATEGLTEKEMSFKPTEQNMNLLELLKHIYGLAKMTYRAFGGEVAKAPVPQDWEVLRLGTLEFCGKASAKLQEMSNDALASSGFMHRSSENPVPFWYLINGPIADALTHVGQISSWRRMAGNPQPKGVSVLWGTSPETEL